jgi:putative ABC transport system substrate-binding protein
MLSRRAFLTGSAAVVMSSARRNVHAQSSAKMRRIGYLGTGTPASGFHQQFVEGMRELGWVAGQNIAIDYRFAEGHYERLPALATELVKLQVELIVAQPTAAAVAAKNATRSIPIVMVNTGDPVGLGLVATLPRPGGNVTGTAFTVGSETFGKGLELLKEVAPAVRRIAVLSNPSNPGQALAVENLKTAALSLKLPLLLLEASNGNDIEAAFERITSERADALLVVAESLFILHQSRLAQRALTQRLPTMFGVAENVAAGGLLSYGPSLGHASRRSAMFADKILKGAKPAELPVEQPTEFELVINLTTAKALGLRIPQSVLLRARTIE